MRQGDVGGAVGQPTRPLLGNREEVRGNMSSRKKRQAVRATREEIRAGRTPTEEATPGQGERQAAHRERQRRGDLHAAEQVQLRAQRQWESRHLPPDRLAAGNADARWDYAVLHVAHQVDELGAPLLRDAFAGWLDGQRGARFQGVWTGMGAVAPAVVDALWLVLAVAAERELDLADPAGALMAEEEAAVRLGLPVMLVRRRAGVAVRLLRAECHAEMPPLVRAYAQVRAGRWARYAPARRPHLDIGEAPI